MRDANSKRSACVWLVFLGACGSGDIVLSPTDGEGRAVAAQGASGQVAATAPQTGLSAVRAPVTTATASASPSAAASTPGAASGDLSEQSRAAFASTLHPVLQQHCSGCHSASGTGQLPMHSDVDLGVAFDAAQRKVNLRQPEGSRFIKRLAIDHHHCWSECAADAAVMHAAVIAWAAAVAPLVPPISMPVPESASLDEATVLQWIAADKAKLSAADAQYIRYASLHEVYKLTPNQDYLNTVRVSLSKMLNSSARHAPKIVNPVAIDPYSLVYRFDVRDYWAFERAAGGNPYAGATGPVMQSTAKALKTWERVAQGNTGAEGSDAKTATFPNIAGFHPEYVEATQLVYTLSRPDVYNEIMSIPFLANALESELKVDRSKGVESYQYMTVNDAITINERLMYRASIPDGFYWRSIDQFSMTPFVFYDHPVPKFVDGNFSQIVTTRLDQESEGGFNIGKEYDGSTGLQAQASEVIFSLPNGLQAYAIFGAGNQRRVDAFTFIVVDPRRAGRNEHLINGSSCISCHSEGMNRASDDMAPYLDANPTKFDASMMTQLRKLYPGTPTMREWIEKDRIPFVTAMQQIQDVRVVGTADKNMYTEPVGFAFEIAQALHDYTPTSVN